MLHLDLKINWWWKSMNVPTVSSFFSVRSLKGLGRATSEVGHVRVSSVEREVFLFFIVPLKWNLAIKGRTRRRNELSSSSSSETSPKHEAKRNPTDADVAAMACSADKQDDTNPSLLDMWNALKRIENNTNSLIKDIKDFQKLTPQN